MPERSLGSRIKTQGDEGHDWTRQTVATSQAGVVPLCACAKPIIFIVLAHAFLPRTPVATCNIGGQVML